MYVKLFSSILDSSVWVGTDRPTKLVWITLLAMADEHGVVYAALPGLAKRAEVTEGECQSALDVLMAPDRNSRTPDHEGRRVEQVEGGWLLLNHQRYREIKTRKQMADAARQAKKRAKDKGVTRHNEGDMSPVTRHDVTTEDRSRVSQSSEETVKAADAAHVDRDQQFEAFWAAYPKRAGGNPKKAARQKWDARIKDRVAAEAMLIGAQRYAKFCDATGKTGTEYVKQAQFWLAPNYAGWDQPWVAPAAPNGGESLGFDDRDFDRAPR